MDRLLVSDGARGRVRRGGHSNARGEAWRLLGDQRREDVHHECAVCGRVRRHGGDRPRRVPTRHLGVHH